MDAKTRFVLAALIGDTKKGYNAKKLFQMAVECAGKKSAVLVNDGLESYAEAFDTVLAPKNPQDAPCIHIKEIHLDDEVQYNNIQERLNETVRLWKQSCRGLKNVHEFCLLLRFVFYYNMIRPHRALGRNVTLAEAAGTRIEGPDRWKMLIAHAALENAPP